MLFAPVRPDIAIVAEAAMVLIEVLSLIFTMIVVYICIIGRPLRAEATFSSPARLIAQSAGFLAVVMAMFAATHLLAHRGVVLAAIALLGVGMTAAATYYFAVLRKHIRPDDNRIQYTMMVWGALALLTFVALLFLWLAREHVQFEARSTIGLDTLAQIAGIVVSAAGIAFTYVMKSEQSNKTANHKIYQTLELQSVDLFRFECDHPDLIEALWYCDPPPAPGCAADEVGEYRVKQYICQMLNLFEMAHRFRIQGIMGEEVFGSWVIWMWELCSSAVFRHYWADANGLPANYVKEFRALMQMGVDLHDNGLDDAARRAAFFRMVAEGLNCDVVERWFVNAPRRRFAVPSAA